MTERSASELSEPGGGVASPAHPKEFRKVLYIPRCAEYTYLSGNAPHERKRMDIIEFLNKVEWMLVNQLLRGIDVERAYGSGDVLATTDTRIFTVGVSYDGPIGSVQALAQDDDGSTVVDFEVRELNEVTARIVVQAAVTFFMTS